MKKHSLNEIKEKHFGKVGTPRRDAYEKGLINEINKQTMKRETVIDVFHEILLGYRDELLTIAEATDELIAFLEAEIKKAKKKAKKKYNAEIEELKRIAESKTFNHNFTVGLDGNLQFVESDFEEKKAMQEVAQQEQTKELPKVGEVWMRITGGARVKITNRDGNKIEFCDAGDTHITDIDTFLMCYRKVQDAPKQKPSLEYVKKDLETLKMDNIKIIYGFEKSDAVAQLEAIIKYIEEN